AADQRGPRPFRRGVTPARRRAGRPHRPNDDEAHRLHRRRRREEAARGGSGRLEAVETPRVTRRSWTVARVFNPCVLRNARVENPCHFLLKRALTIWPSGAYRGTRTPPFRPGRRRPP